MLAQGESVQFIIRAATAHDVGQIARLTRNLLDYEHAASHSHNSINPWAATEEEINKQLQLPNAQFFVAEREHEVVGYIRAVIVGRKLPREKIGWMRWIKDLMESVARKSFTFFMRRPRPAVQVESGYIAGTFVATSSRHLGIGRALAKAAETWFLEQGMQHSELHVLFNNEAARRMWEELGYEPLALGMRKKL